MDRSSARLREDEVVDRNMPGSFVGGLHEFENDMAVNEGPLNGNQQLSINGNPAVVAHENLRGTLSGNHLQFLPPHLIPLHDISPQNLSQHACLLNLAPPTAPPAHDVGSFLPRHLQVRPDFEVDNPITQPGAHILNVLNPRQSSTPVAPRTGSMNQILNAGYRNQYEVDAEQVENGLPPNPQVQPRSIFGQDSQFKSNLNPPVSIPARETVERDTSVVSNEAREARARRAFIMRRSRNAPAPILPLIENAEAIAIAEQVLPKDEERRIKNRGAVQDCRERKRNLMVAIAREVELYEWEHRRFDEKIFSHLDKIEEEARAAGVDISGWLSEVRRLANFSALDSLPEPEP